MTPNKLAALVVGVVLALFAGELVFDGFMFYKTSQHVEIPPVLVTAFAATASGAAYWMFKRDKK